MKLIALAFCCLAALVSHAVADEKQPPAPAGTSFAARWAVMTQERAVKYLRRGFVSMVGSRMPDPVNPKEYAYRTVLFKAAGVRPDDSEQEKLRKIRETWARYVTVLTVDNTVFDTRNGNLLKFAVTEYFDDFLNDAAKWQVEMNMVDKADGMTLLDYLENRIVRMRGTSIEPRLRRYYDTLRAGGARHRSEL